MEHILAPFNADVCNIYVRVGEKVSVGQVLMVLEAMKMQSPIESKVEGTVEHVWVKLGQSVNVGDRLISISPESSDG